MSATSETSDVRLRLETSTLGETTRIVLHGEADIANVNQLDAALTGVQLDGTKSVCIDASDLAFFDVATLRCLTTFATRVRRTGRDLVTYGATPLLHSVTRALELHDDLGLRPTGPNIP